MRVVDPGGSVPASWGPSRIASSGDASSSSTQMPAGR